MTDERLTLPVLATAKPPRSTRRLADGVLATYAAGIPYSFTLEGPDVHHDVDLSRSPIPPLPEGSHEEGLWTSASAANLRSSCEGTNEARVH